MAIAADNFLRSASRTIRKHVDSMPDYIERQKVLKRLRSSFEKGDLSDVRKLLLLKRNPVNIRTFIEDKDFLGMKGEIYPKILDELVGLNSGRYEEAVLTGAIGCGKTTVAVITQAYHVYLLSCYTDPHALYDLSSDSEIVFIFQNLNATLAKQVDFTRFKTLIEGSPYFQEEFPFNKNILSEMRFDNRITARPVSGMATGALGQNVFSAVIDEVNDMAVVENSKMALDGGLYNQAVTLYNTIARRRKSRFMRHGNLPGILSIVGSKKYPGQFTDVKMDEAARDMAQYGRSTIFVYDKKPWDVLPEDRFSTERFRVFVGDETRKPRILDDTEQLSDRDDGLVDHVPVEYRHEYEADIMNALRDISGVSTLAKHPFMMDTEAVVKCFTNRPSLFSRSETDFDGMQISFNPKTFYRPELPRFVHLDLALTGDSAGLAIGCVDKFVRIQRGEGLTEVLPRIHVDGLLEVRPPKGGEIKFFKIRELLYKLRDHGLNVKWVTADSFQSADGLQILRQKGFVAGLQSMDVDTMPYDVTKTALYDGRVDAPVHAKCQKELVSLERDVKRKKIDHPPGFSKDVSDALSGIVFGLTMRREVWAMYGIPLTEASALVRQMTVKTDARVTGDAA